MKSAGCREGNNIEVRGNCLQRHRGNRDLALLSNGKNFSMDGIGPGVRLGAWWSACNERPGNHVEEFTLYSESKGEPLEGLRQGI